MRRTGRYKEPQLSKLDEIAIQETAKRQESAIQLIYHSERKALQLVGTYLAMIAAVLSATLALSNLQKLDRPAKWAIGFAVVVLYVAVFKAFRAQWTAEINVTGRKPDFWQWARTYKIEPTLVVDAYLCEAAASISRNEAVNKAASRHLKIAYIAGLIAPPGGILTYAWTSYFFH